MRNEISVFVIINRPPSHVFASLIDLNKWAGWAGENLVSMEQVSTDPLQVGSQIRQMNRIGGRLTEATGLMDLVYKWMLKWFVMSDLHKFKKTVESTQVARV